MSRNLVAADYLDITLEVKEDGEWVNITKTEGNVQVVIRIPKDLLKKADNFYVLRLHDGEATLLYDVDEDPETVTINTDGFSTYVMLYQEKEKEKPEEAAAVEPAEPEVPEVQPVSAAEKAPDTGNVNTTQPDTGSSSDSDMWRIWVFGLLIVLIVGLIIVCIKGPKMLHKD